MRDYYVVQFFISGKRMTSEMMLLRDATNLMSDLSACGIASSVIFVCEQ